MNARRGHGAVTVIHDPGDEPETTHQALAAHDPEFGQITVHPTVGSGAEGMLAADVLAALGCRVAHDHPRLDGVGTAETMWASAACWLAADGIDLVIVLRAHRLPASARGRLPTLAYQARVRVIAVWHGPRPESWAAAFGTEDRLVREADDLAPALTGARPRPQLPPALGADGLPPITALPAGGLARFRAEAHRTLTSEQFAALDEHYLHGLHSACAHLTARARLRPSGEPAARPPAGLGGGPCPGSAPGREHHYPLSWPDQAGLQGFLSGLSATAPSPAAMIARIRGAQAGMLAHGVALQVPSDLARAAGPGLTSTCLTPEAAAQIRRHVAHPPLAAALAISMFTGLSSEKVTAWRVPVPIQERADQVAVPTHGRAGPAIYTVPAPAQPIIDAAISYGRLRPSGKPLLHDGPVPAAHLHYAAASAGIALPGPEHDQRAPWHTLAAAWIVGEPLHPGHPHPHTARVGA